MTQREFGLGSHAPRDPDGALGLFSEEQRSFLAAGRVAHLATASAGGTPHVVPICYAFDGRRLYSVIDEKPKRTAPERLRRMRNLETNPAVSLVVDRYDEDWSSLGYVLVTGVAEVLQEGEEHAHALTLLREKYPQYRAMNLESRPVIRVTPRRVTGWGRLDPRSIPPGC